MNELKRKLVFNASLEETIKKFRSQSITCLEDLSNEIFYEIVDYFDGCEIVETFSNLNSRFEQLLRSSLLLIKTHVYLFHHQEMMNTNNEVPSTKICSNLKMLSISSKNITFLNAHRWEKLISHYYPQLEQFYLIYYDYMDNDNQYPMYSEELNQFSSSFWIERKWVFEAQIKGTEIKYLVYPHRKTWYDSMEDRNTEYSKSTTLKLKKFVTFVYDEMLIEQTKRILTITQIYHLNIVEKSIFLRMLIELVVHLPYLMTLKLHALSYENIIRLTRKQFIRRLWSIKHRSQITKVYIKEINDIRDFYYISGICPDMIYSEVKHINMDIQCFLRTTLNRINDSGNSSLGSLCFHVPIADDQIIQNVDKMIRSEKLLFNYTIKRVCDKIYLQWK